MRVILLTGKMSPVEPKVGMPGGLVYRVFVSHATVDLPFASNLTRALANEHVRGFLAPTDIPASTEWALKIERELRECGALIAITTPSFHESKWCDQEAGYALGQGHVIVPVRTSETDPSPYGLLGRFQAITVDQQDTSHMSTVASEI